MTSIMQFGILTEWENITGEGIITRDDGKTGNVHRLCVVPTAAPWRVDNTPVLKVGDRVSFEEEIWCLNVRRDDGPRAKPSSSTSKARAKARAKAKRQQVEEQTDSKQIEGGPEDEEQMNTTMKSMMKATKKKPASIKKTMKATKKKPASENKEK